MIRRTIFALIPVAFVLTILAPNESLAQLGRPGLVATEQIVVGGDPRIGPGHHCRFERPSCWSTVDLSVSS